jgi:superfamily II DNA or RNA helicase
MIQSTLHNARTKVHIVQKYTKTRITNFGYHIDISELSNTEIKQIEQDLTAIPYILGAKPEDMIKKQFTLFGYSSNRLEMIIPRYYGITKFGKPLVEEFDPEDIDVEFTGTLREKQQHVCDNGLEYIRRNGGGLLSVPCGFGKTVCAIYMAHRLGLKTLIVVHKSFLLKQWTDSILAFLNIDKSKIGIIRQKQCDVEGKDFVIGMIQTISKRNYGNLFKQFGFVIFDEAHHVACKFYAKTLNKTCAKYTLALTATPYRGDRMIKIMYWYLGGTIYRERVKVNKNMIVKIINHRSSDKKLFSPKKKWFDGEMRPDTGKMTTNLCEIDSRNNALLDMIIHMVRTDPDRKILILSGRVTHLEKLKKITDSAIKNLIDRGELDDDEINICMYTGKTSQSNRHTAEETGDVIFATYDMANEGLDIKRLNTIIFASPKKDVMQSVGRILRTVLKTGDVRPMVIDFSDMISAIGGWLKTRLAIYKQCKYMIENFYLDDYKYLTGLEFSGLKISKNDMHHQQIDIHNIINYMNRFHNSRIEFITKTLQNLEKIENKLINTSHKLSDISLVLPHDMTKRLVLADFEHTKVEDILYVPKLTSKDVEIQVVKEVDEFGELNIAHDIIVDESENINESNVIQAIVVNKNKLVGNIFARRNATMNK